MFFQRSKTDFYDKPDSVLKIALGGDKGGKSMKFHFQICHLETSVFDVHVFCMFEGSDSPENMSKVLEKYSSAFQCMADPNFRIQGHKVEFFLGGDFKYLDGILGTQGSSAKMPCAKCKVGLDHLQGHGGRSHGPEYCDCTLRSLEEMEGHYNANLCDTRGGKRGHLDLSSTGRYHESIKGRNLFKFIPLANVIPPILHITLGIVLRLFNKLLDQCRIVDETYNKPNLVRIDKEWHQRSLDLEEKEVLVREIGGDYIDLVNFGERLEGDIDIIARQ